jgi:hemerythrin superfamily protein
MSDAMATGGNGDVVALLKAQHEQVRQLFSDVSGSTGESRRDAFECLVRLLAVHETAEEEVVYPAVKRSVDGGDAIVQARLQEEDSAKQMLSDLEKIGPEGERFQTQLAALQQAVLTHAEHEEQEVFPQLRAALDAETLSKMASSLETAEKMAPTHPHPHGPESAAGNIMVGPFVAVVDRVRDALRSGSKS